MWIFRTLYNPYIEKREIGIVNRSSLFVKKGDSRVPQNRSVCMEIPLEWTWVGFVWHLMVELVVKENGNRKFGVVCSKYLWFVFIAQEMALWKLLKIFLMWGCFVTWSFFLIFFPLMSVSLSQAGATIRVTGIWLFTNLVCGLHPFKQRRCMNIVFIHLQSHPH